MGVRLDLAVLRNRALPISPQEGTLGFTAEAAEATEELHRPSAGSQNTATVTIKAPVFFLGGLGGLGGKSFYWTR
jgi:hypothetical protein